MITTFFLFFYILLSFIVLILTLITLHPHSSSGFELLIGKYVIPVSVFLGVMMITCSLIEKNYPTELIFQLICLLILFIILTPLSSYIILTTKNIHENYLYCIPFSICGFSSLIPAVLKIFLVIQGSTGQFLTIKTALFFSGILYVLTMLSMVFVRDK